MAAAFRAVDVTRAIRGARDAGLNDVRVEIDPRSGRIIVLPIAAPSTQDEALSDELQAWRAENGDD